MIYTVLSQCDNVCHMHTCTDSTGKEFHDSICEGDGPYDIRCWKFLLLAFKASQRKNYAIEAFTLLAQYEPLFPERLSQQLLWSRFVNTQGKPGLNIPCDLHMEHCNCLIKTAISHLGANMTTKAITRVGKCAGPLMKVCQQYDRHTCVVPTSTVHTAASFDLDLKKVVNELVIHSQVFQYIGGCEHSKFKSMRGNLLRKLTKGEVIDWMQEQFDKLA